MKQKLFLTFFALALLASLLGGCGLTPEDATPAVPPGASSNLAGNPADAPFAIHFLDVGQADSILIVCDGQAMLVDGGNVADSSYVVSYLEKQHITELSYMVCTHAHEDHVGGLSGPLNTCRVDRVFSPVDSYNTKAFSDFVSYTEAQGLTPERPAPGTVLPLGGAEVTVLGPLQDYEETNNTSIVLMVEYGETRFLLTGDMESDAEQDLIDAGYDLHADVLKVGHHGSYTSTCAAFYDAVRPTYAVISCGKDNDYGHPHDVTLHTLADSTIYRTDLAGAVICYSDGASLAFRTEANFVPQTGTDATAGGFIGNRNTHVLHVPSCGRLPNEENRVYFDSYTAALDAGYTPHSVCIPK